MLFYVLIYYQTLIGKHINISSNTLQVSLSGTNNDYHYSSWQHGRLIWRDLSCHEKNFHTNVNSRRCYDFICVISPNTQYSVEEGMMALNNISIHIYY